jgi:hypothetical protein
MATAPFALRLTILNALVTAIDAQTAASVSAYFPGRDLQSSHIWCSGITGEIDYRVMAKASLPHDDQFTLEFACYVLAEPGTAAIAAAACAALMDAVNKAVSANPNLSATDGLFDVLVGPSEGPDIAYTDNGCDALGTVSVLAHTRVVN